MGQSGAGVPGAGMGKGEGLVGWGMSFQRAVRNEERLDGTQGGSQGIGSREGGWGRSPGGPPHQGMGGQLDGAGVWEGQWIWGRDRPCLAVLGGTASPYWPSIQFPKPDAAPRPKSLSAPDLKHPLLYL